MYVKTIIEVLAYILVIMGIWQFAVIMADRSRKKRLAKLSDELWIKNIEDAADNVYKSQMKARLNAKYGINLKGASKEEK